MNLRTRSKTTTTRNDETTSTPKRPAQTTLLRLKSPAKKPRQTKQRSQKQQEKSIYDMNLVEINDALKARLYGQDETMDRLTGVLYEFNQRPVPRTDDFEAAPLILPLVLAGVSGTGKTVTAKLLRRLYGVESAQYIKYDLTRITDESQLSIILGSAPGLIHSASRSTLPMDLLRAVGRTPPPLGTVPTEQQYVQQQQKQQQQKTSDVRTILLHFDETDKAHPSFMTLMLNFIEEGELTSSSDVKFELPRTTRLIIVFTGNFAEDTIGELCPLRHWRDARHAICADMEERGVPKAVLGRLPHILPYFRLDETTMKHIGDSMVTRALTEREHAYTALFSHFAWSDTEVIERIKSNYMNGENAMLGMRGLTGGLKEFRTLLCYGVAMYLSRHATTTEDAIVPVLSYRVFDWPCDELCVLMRATTDAFSRSLCVNIEERLHRRHNIGLLMVHHELCLIHCLLDEYLPQPVEQSASLVPFFSAPSSPSPHQLQYQRRRLLLISHRQIRCSRCRSRHRPTDACFDQFMESCGAGDMDVVF